MRQTKLGVRAADADDAEAIAAIHVSSWRAAYTGVLPEEQLARMSASALAPLWHAYIVSPDSADERLWVVADPSVIGYARTGPSRDEDEALRLTAEIYGFYVDPPSWGRGTGRALMEHVIDDLSGRGFERATLWVAKANERARGFYERMGWRADGRDDKPFHGAPQLRYRTDLTAHSELTGTMPQA